MKNILLALSGGGIRAIAFHMGVLKYLADLKILENISKISSVSGGSILIGLILNEAKMEWPTSTYFASHIFPLLRKKLCTKSIIKGMCRTFLNPLKLHFLIYRANLLSKILQYEWGITNYLSDLPDYPEISINGSTAETGKRFRFKKDNFGDYELGYVQSNKFPLSDAMAVSAAIPGGLGPLILKTNRYKWLKRPSWDSPEDQKIEVICPYNKLHLYDGGVYDNLGLEPFFDTCKGIPKYPKTTIIVSDASAPYRKGFSYFTFNPWRFKRVIDLMSEQTRSLRVRGFFGYIYRYSSNDKYISIQDELDKDLKRTNKNHVCNYPTSLNKLTIENFDLISYHGYQVAKKYISN